MWPFTLSGRLLIVALVGRYPANKLIRRGSISYHRSFSHCTMRYCALMRYYQSFPTAIPLYEAGYPRVTHPSATKCPVRRSDTPFDLHVLGTPPAFILSQDQTLMFEWSRLTATPPAFILSQDQTLMFEWSRLTASCYLFPFYLVLFVFEFLT